MLLAEDGKSFSDNFYLQRKRHDRRAKEIYPQKLKLTLDELIENGI